MERRRALYLIGGVPLGVAMRANLVAAADVDAPVFAHWVTWHRKDPGFSSWDWARIVPNLSDGQCSVFGARPPGIGDGIEAPNTDPCSGYDSLDQSIIVKQSAEMQAHGMVPLASWWGPRGFQYDKSGDLFLDAFLASPATVKLGILYEASGRLPKNANEDFDFADPAVVEQFTEDVMHLHEQYWSRPEFRDRFYRVDGKPVLFIWLTHASIGPFDQVMAKIRKDIPIYIIGSDFSVYDSFGPSRLSVIRGCDAISAYGIYAQAIAVENGNHLTAGYTKRYVQSVLNWSLWLQHEAPGVTLLLPTQFSYWDNRGNAPLVSTFEEAQQFAVSALGIQQYLRSKGLPIRLGFLHVSYNEEYEGSSVEPSKQLGSWPIELIRDVLARPTAATRMQVREFKNHLVTW